MKNENAIEVKDLKKSFKLYYDKGSQLKERVLFRKRNRYEKREVLKGISFDVKKGEAIGLIGHNGCGKSTTLKLLTRIIYPDSGSVEMKGRVSSLIELGAGFHPDMSGRENIYTNASIFGLSKKEIDEKIQDIIDFSEIEEFIDNPVRTYSSGMYMRLAFSVAINVNADILLIDEILAVGDAGFQTKCFNKLKEIKRDGTTIVIVSHSMGQIEQICDRSIWIHEGLIKAEGTPRDVHPLYMDYMSEERRQIDEKEHQKAKAKEEQEKAVQEKAIQEEPIVEDDILVKEEENTVENVSEEQAVQQNPNRWGSRLAQLGTIELLDNNRKPISSFMTGDDIIIRANYSVKGEVLDAIFGIGIIRIDGVQCYGTNTLIDNVGQKNLVKDDYFEVELKKVQLLPGKYMLDVAIESGNSIPIDYWRNVLDFTVYSKIADAGIVRIEHEWKCNW